MITPDPNLKGRCVRIPIYMDEEEVWVEYRSFNPEKQLVEVDLSSYPYSSGIIEKIRWMDKPVSRWWWCC